MHRNSILVRSNKMQRYAGIYLLQNHSKCFGCPSHPSSGVLKIVTAASGTGHSNNIATTFLQCGKATLEEGCCYVVTMTCTRGCIYNFKYSCNNLPPMWQSHIGGRLLLCCYYDLYQRLQLQF